MPTERSCTIGIKYFICVFGYLFIYQYLFYGSVFNFGVKGIAVNPRSYTNFSRNENLIDYIEFPVDPFSPSIKSEGTKKKVKIKENSTAADDQNELNKPLEHRKKQFNDDGAFYMGYAKNPFGYSIPWKVDSDNRLQNNLHDIGDTILNDRRGKRGAAHLYNMVSCATGCNPLSYKGYGCYCGFLGSGEITDSIDRCCMMHDVCYSTVNCPMLLVYFVPYLWRCRYGNPQCSTTHLGYDHSDSCAENLCQCDKQLAMCLARRPCPTKRILCMSSPWRLLQNLLLY